MSDCTERKRKGLTIVPLLSSAPPAHQELVMRSSGVRALVSRFQIAPHAEWLLISNGAFAARSKKRARVGETMTDCCTTTPEVWFKRSNVHPEDPKTEPARHPQSRARMWMSPISPARVTRRLADKSVHILLRGPYVTCETRASHYLS